MQTMMIAVIFVMTPLTTFATAFAAAPIPKSAQGVPIPQDKGYFVEEVSDGLYWVTEGTYTMMFLTTGKGVIVVMPRPPLETRS